MGIFEYFWIIYLKELYFLECWDFVIVLALRFSFYIVLWRIKWISIERSLKYLRDVLISLKP